MKAPLKSLVLAVVMLTASAGAGVIAASSPALAQSAASLSGAWTGAYVSAGGDDVNAFDITLRQTGTRLTGTIVEVNAIGDSSKALFLTSTLTGTVNRGQVEFVKTYDGSGGVSHSVTYRGSVDSTGRRIRGVYEAGGATGVFELVR